MPSLPWQAREVGRDVHHDAVEIAGQFHPVGLAGLVPALDLHDLELHLEVLADGRGHAALLGVELGDLFAADIDRDLVGHGQEFQY